MFAAYSPKDRSDINSIYQQFIERSRYIRRDDYQFSNRLCAPLVVSEIGSNQNLHIRMMTSQVRHHTVLHHPLLVFEHEGKLLNEDSAIEQGLSYCKNARQLTAGRLQNHENASGLRYNPVGYFVSKEKNDQDAAKGLLDELDLEREKQVHDERERRVKR